MRAYLTKLAIFAYFVFSGYSQGGKGRSGSDWNIFFTLRGHGLKTGSPARQGLVISATIEQTKKDPYSHERGIFHERHLAVGSLNERVALRGRV